ncbi:hypothetical protein [Noviherbaspirillum sp. UKPF54]|uniref:hypothetical protein n=1 Tax=Noviherbaspirillum sp. UKPF54 TaxID=2601898 RepID=UPI0011B1637E|nr:hypothetical protein [Noviherbaspirillum sp. UKPF54]QDZ28710.1 hypothetical protein FAY22_12565 [Noviherbaspirillum sp. UKPF54]
MTRTRTQKTLAKLAQLIANVHGELKALDRLAVEYQEHQEALARRRMEVERTRETLYLTLKQFDPDIAPESIGDSDEWLRPYGRRQSNASLKRYVQCLSKASENN